MGCQSGSPVGQGGADLGKVKGGRAGGAHSKACGVPAQPRGFAGGETEAGPSSGTSPRASSASGCGGITRWGPNPGAGGARGRAGHSTRGFWGAHRRRGARRGLLGCWGRQEEDAVLPPERAGRRGGAGGQDLAPGAEAGGYWQSMNASNRCASCSGADVSSMRAACSPRCRHPRRPARPPPSPCLSPRGARTPGVHMGARRGAGGAGFLLQERGCPVIVGCAGLAPRLVPICGWGWMWWHHPKAAAATGCGVGVLGRGAQTSSVVPRSPSTPQTTAPLPGLRLGALPGSMGLCSFPAPPQHVVAAFLLPRNANEPP